MKLLLILQLICITGFMLVTTDYNRRIIISVMSTQRQTNCCILVQFCILLRKLHTPKKKIVNGTPGKLERLNQVKFQLIELSYKLVGRYRCFR